jgi:hypothetical protein
MSLRRAADEDCWAGSDSVRDSDSDKVFQASLHQAATVLYLFGDAQLEYVGR